MQRLKRRAHDALFRAVHERHLVYNTSWEDPRVDRELLGINRRSRVVVITSGGCNALDYLLDDPAEVHAVDVNPAQNALMQLKLALFDRGDFDDLYALFGIGSHRSSRKVFDSLWQALPDFALRFWRAKESYFAPSGIRKSFYYHGTAGAAAWVLRNTLLHANKKVRDCAFELFETRSLAEQREIAESLEPLIWDRKSSWLIGQPALLALLGVPRPQIQLIAQQNPGGVLGYVKAKLIHVLRHVPAWDNYFWRVYLHGSYTSYCCPGYLEPRHFETLRDRVDRVTTHDTTLARFLASSATGGAFSHFVLLDHQDWLANHDPRALAEEWRLILSRALPGAKVLMRSAGTTLDFLPRFAREALRFSPVRAAAAALRDRVGTYGSTHLATVSIA